MEKIDDHISAAEIKNSALEGILTKIICEKLLEDDSFFGETLNQIMIPYNTLMFPSDFIQIDQKYYKNSIATKLAQNL